MKKKILFTLLSLCMMFQISYKTKATETPAIENTIEQTESTVEVNENAIYVETGQINLSDLKLTLNGSTLKSTLNVDDMNIAQQNSYKIIFSNNDLIDLIIRCILKGQLPTAIGYSTVYVNEEVSQEDRPMSVKEFFSSIVKNPISTKSVGTPSQSGNKALTLYVAASIVNSGTHKDEIAATANATWSNPSSTNTAASALPQVNKYDYISLQMPSSFAIQDELIIMVVLNQE